MRRGWVASLLLCVILSVAQGRVSAGTFEDEIFQTQHLIKDLPVEEAYVWDKQGKLIMRKTGTVSSVVFEFREISLFKDSTFIHNHCKGYSLSPVDIFFAVANDLQEIRAVSDKRVFILTRPEQGWPSLRVVQKEYAISRKLVDNQLEDQRHLMSDDGAALRKSHAICADLSRKLGLRYYIRILK